MLKDDRGRWILANHSEAESEYEITGVVDGQVHQAIIDRTFVDENGVRLDYRL